MELKPGTRWKSAVCTTEVVVVRPPKAAATLECGGVAMVGQTETAPAGAKPNPDLMKGTAVGKRYIDADTTLELLCVKSGEGSLSLGLKPLALKDTKRLPSSD